MWVEFVTSQHSLNVMITAFNAGKWGQSSEKSRVCDKTRIENARRRGLRPIGNQVHESSPRGTTEHHTKRCKDVGLIGQSYIHEYGSPVDEDRSTQHLDYLLRISPVFILRVHHL